MGMFGIRNIERNLFAGLSACPFFRWNMMKSSIESQFYLVKIRYGFLRIQDVFS